nr:pyridoxamine 5'-phosphate oxidase family protein [Methylobacterium sp. OTU13CASTA1]
MAKQFPAMEDTHQHFIASQKIFFTGSGALGARTNISPRPTEHLHVLDPNHVAYLDLTGSGSETAAHVRADGPVTLMFCAFDGPPSILRLYGKGRVAFRGSSDYAGFLDRFYGGVEPLGARQVVSVAIDLVQTSCGYGVPLFAYAGERPVLARWAEAKGEAGLRAYRAEKNAVSLDGLPTGFREP